MPHVRRGRPSEVPPLQTGRPSRGTSALSRFTVCSSSFSFFFLLRLKTDVTRRKLPERLKVDPSSRNAVDLANIVKRPGVKAGPLEAAAPPTCTATARRHHRLSEDFVDDPDVPPLI